MPVQPHLFSDAPITPPPATEPPAAETAARPAPVWFQRMSLFILVLFCVYLGIIVAVIPWWPPSVWDQNPFFKAHPALWAILRLGAVRGIISGLGLLDIWIGVSEAIHYRETPR